MRKTKLTLAVIGALFATSAQAGMYVLQANKWGAEQAAAVTAAGGTVIYASADAGMAVVDSSNPGFLAAMKGSKAVASAVADIAIQFDRPVVYGEVEEDAAVTLTNETFWNLQWAPLAIQAPEAWAQGYTGAGVRVAVIDGGIHNTHVDLVANLDVAASRSFVTEGVPGVAGCSPSAYNCDVGTFWHGTHVAGIIAARGDNNIGTVGIAPEATIFAAKALHDGSGSFGSVIAAILYSASEGGADIINMSLGAEFDRKEEGAKELTKALDKAVKFATGRGALVVVAAGNSAINFDAAKELTVVPAESGNAVVVSATGPTGFAQGATNFSRPASYSNYGKSLVWVSGPGGDDMLPNNDICVVPRRPTGTVVQFCWVFDLVFAPVRGALGSTATYAWAAGTSMAAPAAAGVAALIKQRHPNYHPGQLKARLAQSATNVGPKEFHGRGFINALRAVTQ